MPPSFATPLTWGNGQSYTVKHVPVYPIADGRIREHWAVRDDLSMLRQLGAIS